jgi:hypothetical protein
MVIIALAALDCLAIRVGSPVTFYCLVFGGLPMQIALVILVMLVLRRRGREEKSLPFLSGFVLIGWICHLAYVALCAQSAHSISRHLTNTLTPVVSAIGLPQGSPADYICRFGVATAYLTMLQLIVALVGGWICHSWRQEVTS